MSPYVCGACAIPVCCFFVDFFSPKFFFHWLELVRHLLARCFLHSPSLSLDSINSMWARNVASAVKSKYLPITLLLMNFDVLRSACTTPKQYSICVFGSLFLFSHCLCVRARISVCACHSPSLTVEINAFPYSITISMPLSIVCVFVHGLNASTSI